MMSFMNVLDVGYIHISIKSFHKYNFHFNFKNSNGKYFFLQIDHYDKQRPLLTHWYGLHTYRVSNKSFYTFGFYSKVLNSRKF